MLATYMVTGWSARYGHWLTERIEAKNMEAAKQRFAVRFPTLKNVKAYAVRER